MRIWKKQNPALTNMVTTKAGLQVKGIYIVCWAVWLATFNASHKRKQSSHSSPQLMKETLSPVSLSSIFLSAPSNICTTEQVSIDGQVAIGENENTHAFLGMLLLGHAGLRASATQATGAKSYHYSQKMSLTTSRRRRKKIRTKKATAPRGAASGSKFWEDLRDFCNHMVMTGNLLFQND